MARIKQFDEEVVLKKAIQLFWSKGYHATSMQDLVDNLGINRASLYSAFGGKRELFGKAILYYQQESHEKVRAFFDGFASIKEAFRQFFTSGIADAVGSSMGKGCFIVNTTTELLPADPSIQPFLKNNKEILKNIFLQYLQKGVAQGEISADKDLPAIASMLFMLNNGLNVVAKIDQDPTSLTATVAVALSVLD